MPFQQATYAVPRLDLNEAFMEFTPSGVTFIGQDVLPTVNVPKRDGTFTKIQREAMMKAANLQRAAGGGYVRESASGEDQAYACLEYGMERPIDDGDRQYFASDFDMDMVEGEILAHKLMLEYEKRVAAAIFNASTWTGSTLFTDRSSAPWATTSTDIKSHILAAKEKVRALTGLDARHMIVNKTNFNNLMLNDDIIGAVQNSQVADIPTLARLVAPILDLDAIYVGTAVKDTADQGLAFSGSDVWSSTYAMIFHRGESNIRSPGIGKTCLWNEATPGGFVAFEEYRDEPIRSNILRAFHYVDELVIDPSFGHLLDVAA